MAQEKTKQVEKKSRTKNSVALRGRTFQGFVIKKFQKRVVIEFERTIYIPKYERYSKKKTKIHAHLPDELFSDIHVGDLINVKESRPISKMIHFVVVEKVNQEEKNEIN